MKLLHSMAFAAALAVPAVALAGNIPQYSMKALYTTEQAEPLGEGWALIEDGTPVGNANNLVAASYIFKDGTEAVNGYRGEGFPIGFNFRYGGNEFDQFAISPNCMIQLGKGVVDYRGVNIPFTGRALYETYESPMIIGMAPIMGGVMKGKVSYKTVGEEGERVLIVQYQDMVLNETGAVVDTQRGKFNVQFRLHEKDGKIEMAFLSVQTPFSNNGFFTGLHGWDQRDQMIVGGKVDGKKETKTGVIADMLKRDTYIVWSNGMDDVSGIPDLGGDEEVPESFVLTFTPAADVPAPATAPQGLKITQDESTATITCQKAADADATLIMISPVPFTDAETPVDGVSPRVISNNGEFATKYGDATVVYYQDDTVPSVEIPEVDADATLYVRAYSVNGYPNYSLDNFAETTLVTTQLPPNGFITEIREDGMNLRWASDYPVIVAHSTEAYPTYERYCGVFGTPAADAKVGDELEGGGKVVYVGSEEEFKMALDELRPNFPNMFRIWNVKEGVVSATYSDTYGVPDPTFPYEPDLEHWPFAQLPVGYTSSNEAWGWTPRVRMYDKERCFNGGLPNSEEPGYAQELSLTFPELPFKDGPAYLEFEWAAETQKPMVLSDPTNPNSPMIPAGAEPGWFGEVEGGTAGLVISVGPMGMEKPVKTITEYNGKMVEFSEGANNDGSASWQAEKIELGNLEGLNAIKISGAAQRETLIMLRKIKVSQDASGVAAAIAPESGLSVMAVNGGIAVTSAEENNVAVYNMMGAKVADVNVAAGETALISLPSGIYLAGGVKVIVK